MDCIYYRNYCMKQPSSSDAYVDTPCHKLGIHTNSELGGFRNVYARGEHSLHGAVPGIQALSQAAYPKTYLCKTDIPPHPTSLRPYGHDDLLQKNLPLEPCLGGR